MKNCLTLEFMDQHKMLLNIKHTVHLHLHMYTDSFKLQAHFEPNFERDFAKEKKKKVKIQLSTMQPKLALLIIISTADLIYGLFKSCFISG